MKTWSDVPKAVRALADKWQVTSIPEGKDIVWYIRTGVYYVLLLNFSLPQTTCMLHGYNEWERCTYRYTAELLRYYLCWVPRLRVIAIDYNTFSCSHLALQKPPTISQLTHIADRFLLREHLFSLAMHLNFSYSFCERHIAHYSSKESKLHDTRAFLAIGLQWLTRQEGTGELPRTRDTLMKALRKLIIPAYDHQRKFKEMHEMLTQEWLNSTSIHDVGWHVGINHISHIIHAQPMYTRYTRMYNAGSDII